MVLLEMLNRLRKKPRPAFCFVQPVLDEVGSSNVVVLLADLMGGAQRARKMLVINTEPRQHVHRRDAFLVVVFKTLVPSNADD